MKKLLALLAAVPALALAAPAAAQTMDFLKAQKISCVPERMTRCKEPGKDCETRDASAGDRAQPLVIDFAAKKSFMVRDGNPRPFADVKEDKVEGETRRVVLQRGEEARSALIFILQKSGKMDGTRDGGLIKMETTCSAAS
jgi:hypothetical protein